MKKHFIAGILASVLCLGTPAAQAQYYQVPAGAGPYFRMDIGPSFFEDGQLTQFGPPVSSPVKYRTGLAADGAFGYAFNKYIAADFELGCVSAKIDSVPGYTSDNSYLYNVPFLANVILSCPIPRSIVVPYIGAGIGGADVIFDADSFRNNSDEVVGSENDMVFAWQAFAGLRFRLARDLTLGIGYKYFATDAPTFTYPPDEFAVGFKGVRTHSVLATLEWKFW